MQTKTFTYTVSSNFGRYDHLGNKIKGTETKTITWTVRSASAITGGTFLDGSPWVQDNGDLELIDVSPAPQLSTTSFSIKYANGFTASDGVYRDNPQRNEIETEFWKNQTIINPDFGKIPTDWANRVTNPYLHYNNSDPTSGLTKDFPRLWERAYVYINPTNPNDPVNDPTNPIDDNTYRRILTAGQLGTADINGQTVGLYLNADGLSAGSDIEPIYFFGFDGRGGAIINSSTDIDPDPLATAGRGAAPVGTMYNRTASQIWDRTPTAIETGDVVVSCISHEEPYFTWGRNPGDREPIIDMYGALTVVSEQRAATASQRFRPPVNWDPTDKANRPFYQERTISNDLLLEKPDRKIDETTQTDFFANNSLSDFYTDPIYGRQIRTGTVVPFFGDNEWDDTYQGFSRSFCRTYSEYGSNEASEVEPLFLMTMDATLTDAERKLYRRILTQRGLDLYGGIRSLGKHFADNGGHPEPHEYYIIAADMFAEKEAGSTADPYDIHAYFNGVVGNTANGTFKDFGVTLEDLSGWGSAVTGVSHLGVRAIGHYTQTTIMFGSSADFHAPCRVVNATVEGTGVSAANGTDIPYVILSPPNPSSVSAGGATGASYDKSSDSLGFFGGEDPRVNTINGVVAEGRWGLTKNISYLYKNHFTGMYIRNNTTNEIARCIWNEWEGATANDSNGDRYGGVYYTSTNGRFFYTPGITFNVGDKVDFCPMLEEEFNTSRSTFGTLGTIKLLNPNGSAQQYTYSVNRGIPIIGLYNTILESQGRTMPKAWIPRLRRFEGFCTDPLMRYAFELASTGIGSDGYVTHRLVTPSNYGELWRGYIRNIYIGKTAEAAPLYETIDELYHGLSGGVTGTWIPFDANPANPTVMFGIGGIPYQSASNNYWRTIDGVTAGQINRLYYEDFIDSDGDVRDSIFIQSSANRPLPYDDYVNGKQFYMWFAGRNSPLGLTLASETKTSDVLWEQLWTLDANTKIFPRISPLGTDLLAFSTYFYADPS